MASRKAAAARPALDTKVRALRDLGHRTHCTIHAGIGANHRTFVRCPDGNVYGTVSGDMARATDFTEVERRAWCVLKGVTIKALKEDMERRHRLDADERRAQELSGLQDRAQRIGMKLVKVRTKPGARSVHAARLLKAGGI